VDWYRFKVGTATTVRLVLGDLSVPARMELYTGCSTLLQVADRAGTGSEEIIRRLPAGTYGLRLVGNGLQTSSYALLMKALAPGQLVWGAQGRIEGSNLRITGEIFNNTSRTVGPVTVTVRLYNAKGTLLATRSARADVPYVEARTRTPFTIVGPLPAGYDHRTWSVSAPATTTRVVKALPTVLTARPDATGHLVVTGTLRNTSGFRIGSVSAAITLYDARRNVIDVARASIAATTLGIGATTTFRATFLSTGLRPDLVYVRAVGVH
jgi:hypothetical protein